ncbi:Disease resistance protein RML1A [Glycine soja]|uniref:Disease resistance protein RML1A n=1 Tax=Glycine soja TaxID=3848 RepID=A0A445GXD0_GLYSO|nr:Disease resistance protein RML1A [Glycine soja]
MQNLSRMDKPKTITHYVLISSADDTVAGFTSTLAKSLEDQGFPARVLVDHRDLKKAEIETVRVFIVVLSEHYAICPFRLDKLAEIVDGLGARQRVLPVFYYVPTSDVRYQTGSYEVALGVHEYYVERERLEKWKNTLEKVAGFGGWPLQRTGKTYEYQYIEEIGRKVSEHVACSVELHSRVQKVNELLYSESDDGGVKMVGICGEDGTGKTTVACGVYYSNAAGNRFDYFCFLDKVGECLRNHGFIGLIGMLLSGMIGDSNNNSDIMKFGNTNKGMSILKRKFLKEEKKLFLVLEDIYDEKQLQDIVRLTNCFSSNSKVVITTKDNSLLHRHEIRLYEVERFKTKEAFQLLSLKAFNSKNLKSMYLSILERAETYASGNPFILEVMGSYLRGKSVEECVSALDQYEKIPNKEKQRIVQISFDALEKCHQKMLSCIAFYLNRQDLQVVEEKLYRQFRVSPKDGIKVLLDKSLIKINEHGRVIMHDLTQNMVKDNGDITT